MWIHVRPARNRQHRIECKAFNEKRRTLKQTQFVPDGTMQMLDCKTPTWAVTRKLICKCKMHETNASQCELHIHWKPTDLFTLLLFRIMQSCFRVLLTHPTTINSEEPLPQPISATPCNCAASLLLQLTPAAASLSQWQQWYRFDSTTSPNYFASIQALL